MLLIRRVIFSFITFFLSINYASATCTGPSGVYSGVTTYFKYTGSSVLDVVYNVQITATVTYSSSSSSKPVSASITTLTYNNGSTAGIPKTVTVSSSTFSRTTCLGTAILSDGSTYKFSVTGSGEEINFLITPPTTQIFYSVIQGALKKV